MGSSQDWGSGESVVGEWKASSVGETSVSKSWSSHHSSLISITLLSSINQRCVSVCNNRSSSNLVSHLGWSHLH